MKTKKALLGNYLFLSILIFPFLLVSCEEDLYDLRDDMVGFYDYELKAYIDTGDELLYIGDQPGHYDVTGIVEVMKNPDYEDMLDFWEGSDLLFQGEYVRQNDNTITFDIPLQEFWAGPVPVTVRGWDYWLVNADRYHGAYIYNSKSIEIGFAAEVMDVESDLVLIFIAYRQ
jgi:hypothetical protein